MEQLSLKAICKEYGLSRRTIQGYERIGLIKPTSKNKYGHLLYDEKTIQRILFIKFFQNIGYQLKEISSFIDSPKEVIKEKIVNKIEELESNIKSTRYLIFDSKRIIELLDEDNYLELIYQMIKKENIK